MQVQARDIRYCLDKSMEISEHYKMFTQSGDRYPRSVDDFLQICKEYTRQDIVVREVFVDISSIRGFFLLIDGAPEIYLLRGNNDCWKRFVLCKELFHVLLDEDQYRDMYIYRHLKDVALSFPERNSTPGRAAVSEIMAEIAAIEFLFPYKERVFQLGHGAQVDYLGIANYFKVPQFFIEKYLSDAWMEYLGAFFPRAHGPS
jgi:Zn-dependent peptidase ImmA (M78 family)